MKLPESKLVTSQTKQIPIFFEEYGTKYRLIVQLRYDDNCGNGHNSFGMTGNLAEKDKKGGNWRDVSAGCIHETIMEHAPDLAKYIKWHLCSSDGPLHYVVNTTHHAGDRDCWGGKNGEVRLWEHSVCLPNGNQLRIHDFTSSEDGRVYSERKESRALAMVAQIPGSSIVRVPEKYHEGKERDLDAARESAIWPEATDEELSVEKNVLTEKLLARLPALMVEFKAAMESLGFVY